MYCMTRSTDILLTDGAKFSPCMEHPVLGSYSGLIGAFLAKDEANCVKIRGLR